MVAADVLCVARWFVETGVTSFGPTMVSSSSAIYRRAMVAISKAREAQRIHCSVSSRRMEDEARDDGLGANILGMHLEGPYFASTKKGAHDPCNIILLSGGVASVLDTYCLGEADSRREWGDRLALEDVNTVTLAPELPKADEVIRSLTGRRRQNRPVIVSLGHTDATYEEGLYALSCGATFVTHLCNAMLPFHHREPGLVG